MSEPSFDPASDLTDDLSFDVVEPDGPAAAPAARACVGCGRPIVGTYYAVGDRLVCPDCRARVDAPPPGRAVVRVLKATALGLGAGLLGAVIWFVLRRLAHVEIGLVAVLVGYLVGKAVRQGSGGRGGRGYQVLAVVLTYCCISANYVPDVVEAVVTFAHQHPSAETSTATPAKPSPANSTPSNPRPTPSPASPTTPPGSPGVAPHHKTSLGKAALAALLLVGLVFGLALAAPFLGGMSNLIGLLIIGFALWEAWKFNARRRLTITGPYQVGAGPPGLSPVGVRR